VTKLRVGARVTLDTEGSRLEFTDLQQALLLLVADAEAPGPTRRSLCPLLWDGCEGATSPRRRLRQIIYAINRRADTNLLDGDHQRVGIAEDVDVIWTGEEAGSAIPPPNAAWSRTRDEIQDRARSRSRTHVASAIDSARLRDDPETILDLVATDADPGSMWRDAVWALFRAGRVREAEASFRDLGIDDPDLVRRCSEAVARLASGDAPGPDPHARATPLLGRESVLGDAIAALQRGDRRIVLAGPSGVGLSRGLGAVTAWAITELNDLVVASTRCTYSGRGVAYDTLNRMFDADLFRDAHAEVDEPWRSILARVLRVYGRTPEREIEPLQGTSATLRVLHAVSALIERAIGKATLLAVVDDLHLADPGSLTVLTHLGVEGDGAVIRLLGTARTDIDVDGPVADLLEPDHATVVRVLPLDASTSRAMLGALRPDLAAEDRRALSNLCGGLPRRLEDVAKVELDGAGVLEGSTLDDLLQARLHDLSDPEQDVLALLSVRPDGLDAEALLATARLGTLDLGRATRRLMELDLVGGDDRFRIWSSFLRRGIRGTLPDGLKQALHLRIARALEERDPPIAADVGRHLYQAGRTDEAREWLGRGAEEASAAEAFPVAIELAELAVELDPNDPNLRAFIGGLLSSEGRFSEASHNLERAIQLDDRDPASPSMIARRLTWVRALAEHVFDSTEVGSRARDILEDARAGGQLDAEAQAIDLLFRVGDYCLDFDLVHEALEHLRSARSRPERSPYLDWVEVRRAYIDDPDAARDAAHRFLEYSEPGSTDRLEAVGRLIIQGMFRGATGDADVLLGMSELRRFADSGHAHLRAAARANLGAWHLERGEFEQADYELVGALRSSRRLGGALPGMILSNRIEVRLGESDITGATVLLDDESCESPSTAPRDQFAIDGARALAHLEAGRLGAALVCLAKWRWVDLGGPISFFPLSYSKSLIRALGHCSEPGDARQTIHSGLDRASRLGMSRSLEALSGLLDFQPRAGEL
jgi:tetratricopeptide (TPR) repeat protein